MRPFEFSEYHDDDKWDKETDLDQKHNRQPGPAEKIYQDDCANDAGADKARGFRPGVTWVAFHEQHPQHGASIHLPRLFVYTVAPLENVVTVD